MHNENDRGELLFLFKALVTWLTVGIILSLILSIIISQTTLDSSYIAYLSSIISFITAVFAGFRAMSARRKGKLYTALFTAGFLIIFILSVAYIIASGEIIASGLISVISFTFSGVFFGAYILYTMCYGNRRKSFNNKRKGTKFT